ncbi:Coenzyme PQQ synthesis protein D (PqqD) [Bacillus sp. OV322]|uniref:lasso peptide biosynthesis PqqD family chaperone n=1 Tax=Bacillus sp. OV322 TaxID=1882764 RepID=UPI0008E82B50|nr:lasso peptide biosynthesis PqqD family chaperone [Bacillus sp. OV322]SFC52253.1 Coenzyme PQQ synthesis protein D (PqqD) [Bacillus sp. OV322]
MIRTHSFTKESMVSQSPGNIVSNMDGEKVMLSIEKGKYYNLGVLGGEIWDRIKEPISLQDLCSNLTSQYDVTPDECEHQVTAFLKQMLDEELIQLKDSN